MKHLVKNPAIKNLFDSMIEDIVIGIVTTTQTPLFSLYKARNTRGRRYESPSNTSWELIRGGLIKKYLDCPAKLHRLVCGLIAEAPQQVSPNLLGCDAATI